MPEKIGLIYVPNVEGQHAPPYSGTIVSVGNEVKDHDFQIGTRVLFHDLAGTEIEIGGEKYLAINDFDIIAILCDKNIEIM